jgi:hypothetical protein
MMAREPGIRAAASRHGARVAVVAAALAIVALQWWAVTGQSLTSDEPYHLAAGYLGVRHGENTLNLEHPPLAKLVAAVPLLAEDGELTPVVDPTRWREASERVFADRALTLRAQQRGRTLILVAFGLPWILACWLLGRRLGDGRLGVALALVVGCSFSVVPYLGIVGNDAAVALGFALTLLAAAHYLAQPGLARAAFLGLAWGLSLAAKFTGVFLAATVLVALALAAIQGPRRLVRRASEALLLVFCALLPLVVTYGLANRNYRSDHGRAAIELYTAGRATLLVDETLLPWRSRLLALERESPGAAQWLTGLLGVHAQNAIGVYPGYALGCIDRHGHWWYFPLLLAVKTPLVLIAVSIAAVVAALRARSHRGRAARPLRGSDERPDVDMTPLADRRLLLLAAVTLAVYLLLAMTSSYNLGYRHLLPILPLLLLPAAWWASRKAARTALVVLALAAESTALGPNWIAATNTWWMGARNPSRFALGGGDFDWNQGLLELDEEARRRRIPVLAVLDPLASDAEIAAYLTRGHPWRPGSRLPPGWYATSLAVERMVPAILAASPETMYRHADYAAAAAAWQPALVELRRRGLPRGTVAGTFRLYRLPGTRASREPLPEGAQR